MNNVSTQPCAGASYAISQPKYGAIVWMGRCATTCLSDHVLRYKKRRVYNIQTFQRARLAGSGNRPPSIWVKSFPARHTRTRNRPAVYITNQSSPRTVFCPQVSKHYYYTYLFYTHLQLTEDSSLPAAYQTRLAGFYCYFFFSYPKQSKHTTQGQPHTH